MSPQARLAEITGAVAAARRALAEGALVDVAGLDAAVSEICDAAEALPAAERRPFADELIRLAEALDALADAIARQGEAAQRQRASAAYGGPEGPR